ncbi:hypothetical protein HKX48_000241, partial [Thoreauomyces humboldtii]
MAAVSAPPYVLRRDTNSPLPPISSTTSASPSSDSFIPRAPTATRHPSHHQQQQQQHQPPSSRTTTADHPSSSSQQDASAGGGADPGASFFSKLTNVEAQRVMSVLMEMQRKVQLVGLLPDSMDRRMSTLFSADMFSAIAELRQLEEKYDSLLGPDDASRGHGRDAITPEMREVGRQIRTVTRSLVRHFIQNPTAASKLRYLKSTKLPSVARFEQLLQEVKVLVYERLGTTVEDEKAKLDQLAVIIAKEQKTSNDVK